MLTFQDMSQRSLTKKARRELGREPLTQFKKYSLENEFTMELKKSSLRYVRGLNYQSLGERAGWMIKSE